MRVIPIKASAPTLRVYLEQRPYAYRYGELTAMWGVSALRTGLKQGYVTKVLPNAYVATKHARRPVALATAVNAWCKHALVSARTALHFMDSEVPFQFPIEVAVPYGQRLRPPDWIRVRTFAFPSQVITVQGVNCVVPETAVLDAWQRASSLTEQTDIFYQALWLKVTSVRRITSALERTPRVRGRRRLMHLLSSFDKGATSPLEVYARLHVFRGRSFAAFEWQGEVITPTTTRRVDMLHRTARVAVEFDGERWHTGPEAVARDRRRNEELLMAGFVTVRLGWADLRRRPEECRALVKTLVGRSPVRSA